MASMPSNNELEVLFDYSQPQDGELRLTKGSRLKEIQRQDDGWLMVMDTSTYIAWIPYTKMK